MPSHRSSGCCRRSYLHLENCEDQPIWKRSWLKGPSKAIFSFPKDVDINRTGPENKQAEMKHKCKQRASLWEQIKDLLHLSPHRVSQTHQQHQSFLLPLLLWQWVRLDTATLCRKDEPLFCLGSGWPEGAIIEQKFSSCAHTADPEHPHTPLQRAPGDTLQSCSLSIMPTFCFNIKGSSAVLSAPLIALTSCGGTRHLMSKPIK